MKSKEIHKLARDFRIKHGSGPLSYESIKKIIKNQGYTLIEFDPYDNDETVSLIISKLDLTDYICRQNAFTYADTEFKLIFVNKNISEEQKIIVLIHEEGHILCGHLKCASSLESCVEQEEEASQFACYMLHPSWYDRTVNILCLFKKQIFIVVICCFLLILSIFTVSSKKTEASCYGEYYITEHGTCYHERECLIIANKTNIRRMTEEEFTTGKYKPCQVCLPD